MRSPAANVSAATAYKGPRRAADAADMAVIEDGAAGAKGRHFASLALGQLTSRRCRAMVVSPDVADIGRRRHRCRCPGWFGTPRAASRQQQQTCRKNQQLHVRTDAWIEPGREAGLV